MAYVPGLATVEENDRSRAGRPTVAGAFFHCGAMASYRSKERLARLFMIGGAIGVLIRQQCQIGARQPTFTHSLTHTQNVSNILALNQYLLAIALPLRI